MTSLRVAMKLSMQECKTNPSVPGSSLMEEPLELPTRKRKASGDWKESRKKNKDKSQSSSDSAATKSVNSNEESSLLSDNRLENEEMTIEDNSICSSPLNLPDLHERAVVETMDDIIDETEESNVKEPESASASIGEFPTKENNLTDKDGYINEAPLINTNETNDIDSMAMKETDDLTAGGEDPLDSNELPTNETQAKKRKRRTPSILKALELLPSDLIHPDNNPAAEPSDDEENTAQQHVTSEKVPRGYRSAAMAAKAKFSARSSNTNLRNMSNENEPAALDTNTNTVQSKGGKRGGGSKGNNATSNNKAVPEIEWVQCDACKKWRKVGRQIAAKDLPDEWYCIMNTWDAKHATCIADEEHEEPSAATATAANNSNNNVEEDNKEKDKKDQTIYASPPQAASSSKTVNDYATPAGLRGRSLSMNDEEGGGGDEQGKEAKEKERELLRSKDGKRATRGIGGGGRSAGGQVEDELNPNNSTTATTTTTTTASGKKSGGTGRGRGQYIRQSQSQAQLQQIQAMQAMLNSQLDTATTGSATTTAGGTTATAIGGVAIVPAVNWVQCNKCRKWRKVPECIAIDSLPEKWYCSLNTWHIAVAKCTARQEDENDPLPEYWSGMMGGNVATNIANPAAAIQANANNNGNNTNNTATSGMNSYASYRSRRQNAILGLTTTAATGSSAIGTTAAANNNNNTMLMEVEDLPTTTGTATATNPTANPNNNPNTPVVKQIQWVQCERRHCKKWRKVPHYIDMNGFPEKWYCEFNTWNLDTASCDVPEDSDSDTEEKQRASAIRQEIFQANMKTLSALSYRRMLFGNDGKIRVCFSEKNSKNGTGIFSYLYPPHTSHTIPSAFTGNKLQYLYHTASPQAIQAMNASQLGTTLTSSSTSKGAKSNVGMEEEEDTGNTMMGSGTSGSDYIPYKFVSYWWSKAYDDNITITNNTSNTAGNEIPVDEVGNSNGKDTDHLTGGKAVSSTLTPTTPLYLLDTIRRIYGLAPNPTNPNTFPKSLDTQTPNLDPKSPNNIPEGGRIHHPKYLTKLNTLLSNITHTQRIRYELNLLRMACLALSSLYQSPYFPVSEVITWLSSKTTTFPEKVYEAIRLYMTIDIVKERLHMLESIYSEIIISYASTQELVICILVPLNVLYEELVAYSGKHSSLLVPQSDEGKVLVKQEGEAEGEKEGKVEGNPSHYLSSVYAPYVSIHHQKLGLKVPLKLRKFYHQTTTATVLIPPEVVPSSSSSSSSSSSASSSSSSVVVKVKIEQCVKVKQEEELEALTAAAEQEDEEEGLEEEEEESNQEPAFLEDQQKETIIITGENNDKTEEIDAHNNDDNDDDDVIVEEVNEVSATANEVEEDAADVEKEKEEEEAELEQDDQQGVQEQEEQEKERVDIMEEEEVAVEEEEVGEVQQVLEQVVEQVQQQQVVVGTDEEAVVEESSFPSLPAITSFSSSSSNASDDEITPATATPAVASAVTDDHINNADDDLQTKMEV